MKKTPKLYTLGEEIANSITHGIGALLSIAALVIMVVISAINHHTMAIVSTAIFGASLIILYTMSTLYHAITNEKAKNVLKIFDHCTIYLLIAGSYTPLTLIALRSVSAFKGWLVFGIVWGIAILGILLYALMKNKFKILNVLSYVVMGWVVLLAIPEMISYFKTNSMMMGLYLLVGGGILYTLGVIFYALQKKDKKYFHSIWHLFVLGGSICHFFSVLYII